MMKNLSVFGPSVKTPVKSILVLIASAGFGFSSYAAGPAAITVWNGSTAPDCAEHDHVSCYFEHSAQVLYVDWVATHPMYTPDHYTADADFTGDVDHGDPGYGPYTEVTGLKPFDDGTRYWLVHRKTTHWRPAGFDVYKDNQLVLTNAHCIEYGHRVPQMASWPVCFSMQCDGYARLIPYPPSAAISQIPMGGNMILGPTKPSFRSYCDIQRIDLVTSRPDEIKLTYRGGLGTSIVRIAELSRQRAVVRLIPGYDTTKGPFCAFRSMYVTDPKSLVNRVRLLPGNTIAPVMTFTQGSATNCLLYRDQAGVTTYSPAAPDNTVIAYVDKPDAAPDYSGTRTLSFNRSDFNGDGTNDVAVYWSVGGAWFEKFCAGGSNVNWGWSEALPVPGDYDGDGRTDVAVYWPGGGNWYTRLSGGGSSIQNWGWSSALPVPGDYDGDLTTDVAVYWPAGGNWYILFNNGGVSNVNWGWSAALPVPGDYDGDSRTDVAVYWPGSGTWYLRCSRDGPATVNWGWNAALPVPGDYDGDSRTDVAVYWPKGGKWYIKFSGGGTTNIDWGWSSALPVPGDYDGNGKDDLAVYWPWGGRWFIRYDNGSTTNLNWGWNAAMPPTVLQY